MCALFHDVTGFEHDDLVSFEDGVEAMCDGEDSASLHEAAAHLPGAEAELREPD